MGTNNVENITQLHNESTGTERQLGKNIEQESSKESIGDYAVFKMPESLTENVIISANEPNKGTIVEVCN